MPSSNSSAPDLTKPLSAEEIADRLLPEDPRISPDGRHLAFTVRAASRKEEFATQAIWLSRDGGTAEQFTGGTGHDGYPRWSPDGSQLVFISNRADHEKHETSKLYTLKLAGGEALPLGDLEGHLSAPSWSPDGARIAVIRADADTEQEKRDKKDRKDAVVVETEKKRNRVWIVDATSGKARQLTFGTRQVRDYAWSIDGSQLAICTTDDYDDNAYCGPGDVWTIPTTGGVLRHLATFPSPPAAPVFVEGGIVVSCDQHWDDPVGAPWLIPSDGSAPRNVLPGHAGQVEGLFPVGGDHRSVALRMVEGTHAKAYTLDVATGTLTAITPSGKHGVGSVLHGPTVSQDGSKVGLVWSAGNIPGEVFFGPAGADAAKVTDVGASFLGRLSRTEVVTWESDGWQIEGILTYPRGYESGSRYPLIVEAHGGPSWQWEDYAFLDWHDWAQMMASHGFAVLAPNPRGSTGRGTEFQKQLQNDVGGGEVRDLINGALAMVERGIADRERLGIGGWSWGGYLTATTITRTDIFKAAMMGAGLANLISDHGTDDIPSANRLYFSGWPYDDFAPYWDGSAMKHIKACKTPTLILHGDADDRVQWTQGAEMFRALKTLGVPVEFVRYPREGHPIVERHHQIDLMNRLVRWFTTYLKG